ncbi:hypothetical protein [Natronolimnobius baerhuensis]|uniref:Uncharacterized protein n=1 Tax=Natronolimnobius baerhuensis TaxID=253108 RepID=A0A202EBB7_9EURY|nr:hypothetical protein [Natronolimnobius baerhuensis]OVE85539.1 hypothetical protein B2G88_01565 [Natronolimnobius baerhuensis]
MHWSRPTATTLALAAVGGLVNLAIVFGLYIRAAYPILESTGDVAVLAVALFAVGAIAAFASAYTRLLTPALGWLAALAGTAYYELTTPMPEWSEFEGYVIVDGPTHVASYANTWYVWLALALFAGVLEFGIRRGYGLGERSLRNLPELPLSRADLGRAVVGFGALVGVATMLLAIRSGLPRLATALAIAVLATAVAAVPLAALLARGLLLPTVLFAPVPYLLVYEVFVTTDSHVHILLFGPYALVLALAWALEAVLRSRLRGWDGGRFTNHNAA